MDKLIGRKIISLSISGDESILSFITDGGRFSYKTYGDCCSETWFADISGVRNLIGHTVKSVDSIDMSGYNVNDGRCRQEFDEVYGYKLTTESGYCDIVFRNSSNGYYGGEIDFIDAIPPAGCTPITDDWSA